MKKLLFLTFFLIPVLAFSQVLDNAVTNVVMPIVNAAISKANVTLIRSLDSGYKKIYPGYGNATVTVDTLNMRDSTGKLVNGVRVFSIYVTTWQGNGDAGGGSKEVWVRYYNGLYTLLSTNSGDAAGTGYFGTGTIAKASWKVTILGNQPVIQVTGTAGIPCTWTFKVIYQL